MAVSVGALAYERDKWLEAHIDKQLREWDDRKERVLASFPLSYEKSWERIRNEYISGGWELEQSPSTSMFLIWFKPGVSPLVQEDEDVRAED